MTTITKARFPRTSKSATRHALALLAAGFVAAFGVSVAATPARADNARAAEEAAAARLEAAQREAELREYLAELRLQRAIEAERQREHEAREADARDSTPQRPE